MASIRTKESSDWFTLINRFMYFGTLGIIFVVTAGGAMLSALPVSLYFIANKTINDYDHWTYLYFRATNNIGDALSLTPQEYDAILLSVTFVGSLLLVNSSFLLNRIISASVVTFNNMLNYFKNL